MNRYNILALIGALVVMLAVGCGDDESSNQEMMPSDNNSAGNNGTDNNGTDNNGMSNNGDNADVTYHKNVRAVIETRCNQCHQPGGAAPSSLDFTQHDMVQALAPLIMTSIENETMPPWQADAECNTYKDDISLTPDEMATVQAWAGAGYPMGEEAEYVAPNPTVSELGGELLSDTPTMVVKPLEGYEPPTDRSDDYRCFTFDPGFDGARFMEGYEVIPDNASILHHLLIYAVPGEDEEDIARLEELENEDDRPGYECFGGPRVSNTLAVAWAPGGNKTRLPEGTGLRFEPGTRFVIQMHYNLSEGGGGLDQSSVNLWLHPEDQPPASEGQMAFVGNLPFTIPGTTNGAEAQECNTVYSTLDLLANGDRDPETCESPERQKFALDHGIHVEELDPRDPENECSRSFRLEDVVLADLAGEALSPEEERVLEMFESLGNSGCVNQELHYNIPVPLTLHAIAPHMHLYGTHLSFEVSPLERNDDGLWAVPEDVNEQAACMAETNRWDFDWQRFYWLKEPVELPRQGTLRLQCRYDNPEEEPIFLGENSRDEMCLVVVYLTQ